MAAVDYYSSHPPTAHGPANPAYLVPPPQGPQRASSQPAYIYPPYQRPNSNSQTPPQIAPPPYQPMTLAMPNPPYASPQPQRNSLSHQQRPDPQSWNQPYPPPGPPKSNLHPQYNPQQFPPPPGQHRPSNSQPYLHPNQSSASFSTGYSSDPERRRRRHHHHKKAQATTRSTDTDGFLGAAGGGLIGDLIFPGLGTVGGALAGWIGGKEYGTHRKRRESNKEIEQREWEEKFDPEGKRRSSDRARRRSHENRG